MGSTFSNVFKVTTFGESHGKAIGVVIDGCPAGIEFNEEYIKSYLNRRRPSDFFSTSRVEKDEFIVLSGVFNGITLGTPISIIVENHDQRENDYTDLKDIYRPGHADYTYQEKYHIRDYRGGGRASGRETVARVLAGAVSNLILKTLGIEVIAYTSAIGGISVDNDKIDLNYRLLNPLFIPDKSKIDDINSLLEKKRKEKDSVGGIIKCIVKNVPKGLGEPIFDKIDAALSKACMSIGAVKAFEMGDGIEAASSKGSKYNDTFYIDKDKEIKKKTNHSGGVLGGISDGSDIICSSYIKPTSSISKNIKTVDSFNRERTIKIQGRHDTCIVPRAVVVVESMVSITITDMIFMNMFSNIENIKKVYDKK